MATETKPETITVKNAGPINELEIVLPAEPGLVVLHGDNGTGKSTTLDAIDRLVGGDGELPITRRDGTAKGAAEGLGVKLTLGKANRKTGECTVAGLDSDYNVRDFVEPGIKDPAAADRARIKGLLAIRGVEADAERFDSIGWAGAHRATIIARSDIEHAPDLVEQARRIKAACEKAAREQEDSAATLDGQAKACREVAEGLPDLDSTESRADVLQGQLEQAIREQSSLTERRNAAEESRKAVATAEAALEEAKGGYTGRTLVVAQKAATAAEEARKKAYELVLAAREALQDAEASFADADQADDRATLAVERARHHEELIAGWQATIEAERPAPVTDDQMNTAVQAVANAREAIEQGARIRDAREKANAAKHHAAEAAEARKEAETLRKAAHGTDAVLADAIASPTITVEDGRLYVPHAKRGKCLVGDLSRGERARLGILEAAAAIRTRHPEGAAAIVFPQDLFEALGADARQLVRETAEEEKIHVFTAVVDFGELRTGGILAETEAATDG
jgi:hypothetical protein